MFVCVTHTAAFSARYPLLSSVGRPCISRAREPEPKKRNTHTHTTRIYFRWSKHSLPRAHRSTVAFINCWGDAQQTDRFDTNRSKHHQLMARIKSLGSLPGLLQEQQFSSTQEIPFVEIPSRLSCLNTHTKIRQVLCGV
jgi:hypothetical protein